MQKFAQVGWETKAVLILDVLDLSISESHSEPNACASEQFD
jgi:hypothetical protein